MLFAFTYSKYIHCVFNITHSIKVSASELDPGFLQKIQLVHWSIALTRQPTPHAALCG